MEGSASTTNDTKLVFTAKTLSTDCEKDLSNLKLQVQQVLADFQMTSAGWLARELKKFSIFIKDEAGLEIYKLPVTEIHKVTSSGLFL